jgi:hypothetical protein
MGISNTKSEKHIYLRFDVSLSNSWLTNNIRSQYLLSTPLLWTGVEGCVRKRFGFSASEYLNSGWHLSKVWMMSAVSLTTNCMVISVSWMKKKKSITNKWESIFVSRCGVPSCLQCWVKTSKVHAWNIGFSFPPEISTAVFCCAPGFIGAPQLVCENLPDAQCKTRAGGNRSDKNYDEASPHMLNS